MKDIRERLDEVSAHGYSLDFSTVFSHTFGVYKKSALTSGAAMLVVGIIFAAVLAGIVAIFLPLGALHPEDIQQYQVANLPPMGLVIYFICIIILSGLGAPFNAGLVAMAYEADGGGQVNFGTAFKYYGSRYFMPLFTASALLGGVSTIFSIGFQLINQPFIGALLGIALAVFCILMQPLIIFGQLNATEAISWSIRIVSKNFLITLALLIVAGLFACLGIIGCCIGIVFTAPILPCLYYSIYVHSVGVDNMEDEKTEMPEML